MRSPLTFLVIFIVTASLLACESLTGVRTPKLGPLNSPSVTGDPCRNADWFEVGRVDGLSGVPLGTSLYAERCRSQGVFVNDELYTAGWQRGLTFYCTPDRGYDAGRAGESYAGICPQNVEPEFLERFRFGSRIAKLEKENLALEQDIERRRAELQDLEVTSPSSEKAYSNETLARRLQSELLSLRDALAKSGFEIRELEKSNQSQENVSR